MLLHSLKVVNDIVYFDYLDSEDNKVTTTTESQDLEDKLLGIELVNIGSANNKVSDVLLDICFINKVITPYDYRFMNNINMISYLTDKQITYSRIIVDKIIKALVINSEIKDNEV